MPTDTPTQGWRMEAYYYRFEPTGVPAVDHILSAVACAGKAWHHTEMWSDDDPIAAPSHLRGDNPEQWIQNAANDAARALTTPGSHQDVADDALVRLRDYCHHDPMPSGYGHVCRVCGLEL